MSSKICRLCVSDLSDRQKWRVPPIMNAKWTPLTPVENVWETRATVSGCWAKSGSFLPPQFLPTIDKVLRPIPSVAVGLSLLSLFQIKVLLGVISFYSTSVFKIRLLFKNVKRVFCPYYESVKSPFMNAGILQCCIARARNKDAILWGKRKENPTIKTVGWVFRDSSIAMISCKQLKVCFAQTKIYLVESVVLKSTFVQLRRESPLSTG